MGGKYEIRYHDIKNSANGFFTTIYTNNWFEFMRLRITKKLIYFKVYY